MTVGCHEYHGSPMKLKLPSPGRVVVLVFVVVPALAWAVRHELIHYEQFKHLGPIRVLRSPSWLVEGMAYGLSEDPRKPLAEPFESWRSRALASRGKPS
jgi:hypothetical protein